jgi:hypothetical protein
VIRRHDFLSFGDGSEGVVAGAPMFQDVTAHSRKRPRDAVDDFVDVIDLEVSYRVRFPNRNGPTWGFRACCKGEAAASGVAPYFFCVPPLAGGAPG